MPRTWKCASLGQLTSKINYTVNVRPFAENPGRGWQLMRVHVIIRIRNSV